MTDGGKSSDAAAPGKASTAAPSDFRTAVLKNLPEHASGPKLGRASEKCPVGMSYVPGSKFRMGREEMSDLDERIAAEWSQDDAEMAHEVPAHHVVVGSFCIDTLPVTALEYAACVDAGRCTVQRYARDAESSDCNAPRKEAADAPASCIDNAQATAYCQAVGARLPTEPEWELAARGTDGRMFPWGTPKPGKMERVITKPFACLVVTEETCGVGRYPQGASPSGVMDMANTHGEWTSSPYCHYAAPQNCKDGSFAIRSGRTHTLRSRTYARRSAAWVPKVEISP